MGLMGYLKMTVTFDAGSSKTVYLDRVWPALTQVELCACAQRQSTGQSGGRPTTNDHLQSDDVQ